MAAGIQLIVGLGNPGTRYASTRHNVGQWLLTALAKELGASLINTPKCQGALGSTTYQHYKIRLLIPSTFMNLSGQAVRATCDYFNLPANSVLIVHDDLDLNVGVVKLKFSGGHGGHNGLRDIHRHLGTSDYYRLRLGIGHPGRKSHVHDYVLSAPSDADESNIQTAIAQGLSIMPLLWAGKFQQAMHQLHSQ